MTFTPPKQTREITALLQIMANLRDPEGGCPWDVEQDYRTIAPYTIEEAYEVADAVERDNLNDLKEELGDLLLQVVFHAQIGKEQGDFDFADVVEAISTKMIRRHPHVFDKADGRDAAEQTVQWEEIKAAERAAKSHTDSLLDDIPLGFPAMTRAIKLQKRAAKVGFDWPDTSDVLDKMHEELGEFVEASDRANKDEMEAEFGDILFTVANLARHLKIDPEASLRRTNEKFRNRFQFIEREVAASGKGFEDHSLDELEALWQKAKE